MHKKLSYAFILAGVITLTYGVYMPVKAKVAQWLIQDAWSESKTFSKKIKPWPWMDSTPVMKLSSDKHNQEFIVLSGDTGNVLAFAPGHNPSSYHPGQQGTVLISAHRDTHFSFLRKVDLGDGFILQSAYDDKEYIYQVSNIEIINSDLQDIEISDINANLKLVSCYPFNSIADSGPLRYVVTANLIKTI